jgi:hypothetical protein
MAASSVGLNMGEVPVYKEDTDLLRRRLDKIKQAPDDVAELFEEVCDAWLAFLVYEFKEESLEHSRPMLDEAKDELKKIKEKGLSSK